MGELLGVLVTPGNAAGTAAAHPPCESSARAKPMTHGSPPPLIPRMGALVPVYAAGTPTIVWTRRMVLVLPPTAAGTAARIAIAARIVPRAVSRRRIRASSPLSRPLVWVGGS